MAINKTQIVQTLLGNIPEASDTNLIDIYLADAESAIFNRMFPFGAPSTATLPTQYDMLHCKLCARYILRRGAEGETSHNENGINRSYGSVNDEDLLKEVMQVVGVR